MGEKDDGAAAHRPPVRLHDRRLRLVIDGARRLVQDEHWAVLQEGPGNGDALALAARELDAAPAHWGAIGLREPDDELVAVRRLRRRDQVALACPRPGVSNVLGDAGREEHRVLRYHRELPAEILKPEVAEVDAVKPDLTLCRVVEPREQADQRALAGSGRARDSQASAGLDVERDVVQDRTMLAVGEGDVAKRDGAAGPPEELGIRSLLDVRWLVEQGEGPLGTRQMELEGCGLPADRLQGLIELVHVSHHHEQLAQGEHPGADVADADEEHGGHSGSSREPYKEVEAAFQAGEAQPDPHAFSGAADEARPFPRFLAERPDDTQRAPNLPHNRHVGALQLLRLP